MAAKVARSKAKEDEEAEAALVEYAEARENQMIECQGALLDKEHDAERRALKVEKRSGIKQPELSQVEADVMEAKAVAMEFRQLALYERFQEIYTDVLPKLEATAEQMRHYTALDSVTVEDQESSSLLATLKENMSLAIVGKLGGENLVQSCKDAEILLNKLEASYAPFLSVNAVSWSLKLLRANLEAETSLDEPRGRALVRKRVYSDERSGRVAAYDEKDGLYTIKWNDGDSARVSFAVLEHLMEGWEEEETPYDLLFEEEDQEVSKFLIESFERCSLSGF